MLLLSAARYPSMTRYGHEVQGNKNRLINSPIPNAPAGDTTHRIILFIFGLHDAGTSIVKYFPYHK